MITNANKNRIEELDIAKGIAIILMVIGHSGIPETMRSFIYLFHMPFFFFVSGLTSKYTDTPYVFARKKFLVYMVPFLVYWGINVVLRSMHDGVSVFDYVESHLYIGCDYPLWFVPVLALSQVVTFCVCRYWGGKNCVAISVLLAISSLISTNKIDLPWSMSVLPFASSCVLLGQSTGKERIVKCIKSSFCYRCICVIACFFILLGTSWFYSLECYNNISTEPVSILFVSGGIGSVMLIVMSSLIRYGRSILKYIGQNTFIIMALSSTIYMFENLYITNFILKYIILFCVLTFLIIAKNSVPYFKKLHL